MAARGIATERVTDNALPGTEFWKMVERHYADFNLTFTYDGVGDATAYRNAKRHIVFVTKEPNQLKSGDDLRAQLLRGPRYQFGHNLARLAVGLLTEFSVRFEEADRPEPMAQALRSIGLVNLKKVPGTATSDSGEIIAAAHRDRKILRQQFHLLDPEVVVGCGSEVWTALHWLLQTDWDSGDLVRRRVQSLDGRLVLRAVHPSYPRMSKREQWEYLRRSWSEDES